MKYFKFTYSLSGEKENYWEIISELELEKRMAFLTELKKNTKKNLSSVQKTSTWVRIKEVIGKDYILGDDFVYIDYNDFLVMYSYPSAISGITEEEAETVKKIVGCNIFGKNDLFYAYINSLKKIVNKFANPRDCYDVENNPFVDIEKVQQLIKGIQQPAKFVEDFGD